MIREIAYVHPDSRREMKAARYLNWRINRRVSVEDKALIARVQQGMGSSSYSSGPLSDGEVCLRSFGQAHAQLDPGEHAAAGAGDGAGVMAERGDGRCDALIIGGGHNGLVCAAYLAQAGLKVTVLERRDVVGGAAVTEEFHPGFRNSVAAYTVSLLNPKVIKDLDLHGHGLRIVERRAANFLPTEDGRYLLSGGERTHDEVARFSARDASRLAEYGQRLESIADVMRDLVLHHPAQRTRGQLAPGVAGTGERGAGGRPPAQARHGPAARVAVAVLDVLRGLSRQLVRE